MLVRIIKNWQEPNLLRQTPGEQGIWDGIEFTLQEVERCDFLVVLNLVNKNTEVEIDPKNIIMVVQEPYIKGKYNWIIEGHKQFHQVYTHYIHKKNDKYIQYFPMLPWHVNKNYDELNAINNKNITKTKQLSWITSNKNWFPGHVARMQFLEIIRNSNLPIKVYGRGIEEIDDKWDGLAPYKYSLAIENSSSPDYWTEKIADCFLAYTMPIYYGCTNIENYFPADSLIKIDINNPTEAIAIIQHAISEKKYEKSIDSIENARKLVLEKYNFFNTIAEIVKSKDKSKQTNKKIILETFRPSLISKIKNRISFSKVKFK